MNAWRTVAAAMLYQSSIADGPGEHPARQSFGRRPPQAYCSVTRGYRKAMSRTMPSTQKPYVRPGAVAGSKNPHRLVVETGRS
jgi:hypothetical protein